MVVPPLEHGTVRTRVEKKSRGGGEKGQGSGDRAETVVEEALEQYMSEEGAASESGKFGDEAILVDGMVEKTKSQRRQERKWWYRRRTGASKESTLGEEMGDQMGDAGQPGELGCWVDVWSIEISSSFQRMMDVHHHAYCGV
ncbi:hypothetical protein L210DRAFT_3507606 [Boletus edulis BED1]|uniref:Uncharacterized protein n=1 Tax=Boletus edulis BED1 TaxID=1328754 RepID=A0AAD4BJU7_BOLED|nr:hypothetical protein L210DRAFT_3507606 [Boletus edulis BED1]